MNTLVPATPNITDLARTAKMLAMSGYFASTGNLDVQIAQLATRILAGAELGFGPFASATDIHIIQGKPVIGANLMASAVKSNPRYDYRVKTLTNTDCVLEYFQDGDSIGVSSFTLDDAKAAGLTGKDNWKKYPRNMLYARAMSNGVRLYCPDVFRGNAVYTGDEIEADEWHVVEPDEPSPNGTPPKPAPEPEPVPQQTVEDEAQFVVEEPVAQVVGTELNAFQKWARGENNKNGPASMAQYGYLIGVIDEITGQKTHKEVLSKLLGMKISSDNVPSATLSGGLLDALVETKKDDDGNEYHNDKYKPKAVSLIKQLGEIVMVDAGQQKLIDEEAA